MTDSLPGTFLSLHSPHHLGSRTPGYNNHNHNHECPQTVGPSTHKLRVFVISCDFCPRTISSSAERTATARDKAPNLASQTQVAPQLLCFDDLIDQKLQRKERKYRCDGYKFNQAPYGKQPPAVGKAGCREVCLTIPGTQSKLDWDSEVWTELTVSAQAGN
jgi:hypothetical protein